MTLGQEWKKPRMTSSRVPLLSWGHSLPSPSQSPGSWRPRDAALVQSVCWLAHPLGQFSTGTIQYSCEWHAMAGWTLTTSEAFFVCPNASIEWQFLCPYAACPFVVAFFQDLLLLLSYLSEVGLLCLCRVKTDLVPVVVCSTGHSAPGTVHAAC
eukprot:GHRR01030370.1.p1 GENE.GHRR01030370.1~~GHRR01030370.1.p1  ORF type:complete len:154 (+),score=20.53 GHRR01030370.1:154-615(+)